MRRCIHDPSNRSTLRVSRLVLPASQGKRYTCRCTACGKETEPRKTRYQAQTDAWYGCWRKEYA